MKKYDFIFAGGGLSGTMLLYFLLLSPFKNHKFLLIDKNLHSHPYRQWSFWTNRETPFDNVVTKQWKKFSVHFENNSQELQIHNYHIALLESTKYYSFIEKEIKQFPNITCIEDDVLNIQNNEGLPKVRTAKETYTADFVFDSTFSRETESTSQKLFMQGLGATVTTKENAFDPGVITFMDFRGSPEKELLFFYLMPFTEKQAIIDVAHITSDVSHNVASEHERLVHTYLRDVLHIKHFSFDKKKFEKIPLIDLHINRLSGDRILRIGAAGGLIKKTTSYGFINILKDSEMIVKSLSKYGDLRKLYAPSKMTRDIDSAMLDLMQKNPVAVKKMYSELFGKPVKGDTILAYLNDELSPLESIKLITRVNPKPMAEIFQKRVISFTNTFLSKK